jgi:7,8-dihydropterin-6-yl-methyl-4-(beta-D-ribofuranosyl)aminobenzene 5'-phosphate synthase
MSTRITVLVDDRRESRAVKAQHGLSLWIEHDGYAILFDTAATPRVLERNAEALGVAVEYADAICLSHGHYDHTGGLAGILPDLGGADLYAHPDIFTPKWRKRLWLFWRSIGMPLSWEALEDAGLRLYLDEGPQEVCPGAMLTGEVERDPRFVPSTPHLLAGEPGERRVDPFRDDQALVLRGEEGLVVVSGCAHSGTINLCRAAQSITGEERLRAVIGGFHLVGASPTLLEATIEAFRELDPQALHPCHCTGMPAMKALRAAFPDRCHPLAGGSVLELGTG